MLSGCMDDKRSKRLLRTYLHRMILYQRFVEGLHNARRKKNVYSPTFLWNMGTSLRFKEGFLVLDMSNGLARVLGESPSLQLPKPQQQRVVALLHKNTAGNTLQIIMSAQKPPFRKNKNELPQLLSWLFYQKNVS